MLQNPNVSAAIVGASRPEQVAENVKAAGVDAGRRPDGAIDEVLAPVAVTVPLKVHENVRPAGSPPPGGVRPARPISGAAGPRGPRRPGVR